MADQLGQVVVARSWALRDQVFIFAREVLDSLALRSRERASTIPHVFATVPTRLEVDSSCTLSVGAWPRVLTPLALLE